MECLFDLDKTYFSVWRGLFDVDVDSRTSPLYWFVDSKDDTGPLYYATLCGFKDLVEKLIITYPHLVNATGGYYKTPALAALARSHLDLARILHQNGSPVDLLGKYQRTPLHSAAIAGDSEIVHVLLDCKLYINAKNADGWTPLHSALLNRPPNYFEVLQLLLDHGADPNARKSDGSTPLHFASSHGTVEDSRLLLKYGADVEAVNKGGKTAFQVASKEGNDEITKFLSAHRTKDIS